MRKFIIFILVKIVRILDLLNIFSYIRVYIFNNILSYAWKLHFQHKYQICRKKNKLLIHCIGDSHVGFFSGYNRIQAGWPGKSVNKYAFLKSYRLGPVLAYKLCSLNTRSKSRERLFYILNHILPLRSKILLCFGEVDCRAHLLKQTEIQKKGLYEIIRECVDRYLIVIKEIKELGFEIIVWNVIPSGISDNGIEKDFPFYGTNLERNRVSKYFNDYLKQKLDEYNINFISIFDKLVSENFKTKSGYYFDGIHLSQQAISFFFKELFKIYTDF